MFEAAYLFNEIRSHPVKYLPMRRSFQAFLFGLICATLVACVSSWPAQRIEIVPGSVTGDSALEGGYRLTSLDGRAAPVEFPHNSGRRIVYGTLDLRNSMAARAGSGGSYSMRFTEQPVNDTVRTIASDGQFVLHGDTLVLSSSGQNQTSRFRYTWRPSGELALTDDEKHVWVYTRR
jgi:hypothetical protein